MLAVGQIKVQGTEIKEFKTGYFLGQGEKMKTRLLLPLQT